MKKTLFFGTGNQKKITEIEQILGDKFILKTVRDLDEVPEVEETEPDLAGNARLKAEAFYALTGIPCFADDTGLEVEALDGAPGVYSARYAGDPGNAEQNMAKLLAELDGKTNRKAQFRTLIAWYDGQEIHYFEGIVKGTILHEKRGDGGFGYDPIFQPEGSDRSLAEHSPEEKNAISHRGRAIRAFTNFILA